MTKISPENADKLAAAAATLLDRGEAVTVRALKATAGVGTDTAAKWLRTNRPPAATLETPLEELTAPLTVLWAAATKLAREKTDEETSAHTRAVERSEAQALTDLDEANQKNADLTATVKALKQQLAAAQAEAAEAQEEARRQTKAANDAQAQATIAAERNIHLKADLDRLHTQLNALISQVTATPAKPRKRQAAPGKVSPENAEKLAAAHKALTARGEKPSRDKLREEAKVSTRDATQWWRDYRKANPSK